MFLTLKASCDLHAQMSRTLGSLSKQMALPFHGKVASPVPECPVVHSLRSVTCAPLGQDAFEAMDLFSAHGFYQG